MFVKHGCPRRQQSQNMTKISYLYTYYVDLFVLCSWPERSARASSNPSVHLSVRNSVALTNKVQYLKFGV